MNNNLAPPDAWRPVMAVYAASLQPHRVEYLDAAGGFSGAQFWRLQTAVGPLCLRRWPPEHPDAERLQLIHDVLRHAAARGIDFLPVPIPTQSGHTFVQNDGTLWELASWLAGEADFSRDPRPEKLRAALIALARFHVATADFPSPRCCVGPSPGIAARLAEIRAWTPAELARLRAALVGRISNPSVRRAGSVSSLNVRDQENDGRIGNPSYKNIIDLFEQLAPCIERELAAAVSIPTQLQPVIRDVRADHFLFTGDEVTGLVDFGGLNIDTPATDIARLLGSLAGDDEAAWQTGLAAYETVRPLTATERLLVPVFDRSGVALAGMNWLRWIYLEQRTFADPPAIQQRLSAIAARMQWLQNAGKHR